MDRAEPLVLSLDEPLTDFLPRAFPNVDLGRITEIRVEPHEIRVSWLESSRPRVFTTSRRSIRVRLPDFPAPPTTPTEKETD